MRVEVPEFRRCCFCIPLRRGILTWAYIYLVLQIAFLCFAIHLVCVLVELMELYDLTKYVVLATIAAILVFFSAVYSLLIIVASHKKSAKMLRVAYISGMVISIFLIMDWVYSFVYHLCVPPRSPNTSSLILESANFQAGQFVQTFLHVYMVLLLRSEMLKLQEQSLEIEFVNNAAGSKARCVSAHRGANDNDSADNAENEARCDSA